MKKFVGFILLLLLAFLLLGCGMQNDAAATGQQSPSPAGPSAFEDESGKAVIVDTLPCEMDVNGKIVIAENISIYQEKSAHGYNAIATMAFDIQELTDDDVYWLKKDEALSVSLELTSAKNGLSERKMPLLVSFEDTGRLTMVFWLNDELRYSLEDDLVCETSVFITQEETYEIKHEGKTLVTNKLDYYKIDGEAAKTSVYDTSEMDGALYKAINDRLQAMVKALS